MPDLTPGQAAYEAWAITQPDAAYLLPWLALGADVRGAYEDLATENARLAPAHAALTQQRDAHKLRADHYEGLWRAEHGLPSDGRADEATVAGQLLAAREEIVRLTRKLVDTETERDIERAEARRAREALEGGHDHA